MKTILLNSLMFACCLVPAARASSIELIQNGDFESGTTSSWTAVSTHYPDTTGSCNDGFAAQTTGAGCTPGNSPIFGNYAAYSSTTFPSDLTGTGEWINTLDQKFTVPISFTNLTLSWYDTTTWGGGGSFRGVNVIVAIYSRESLITSRYTIVNPGNSGSLDWTQHTIDLTDLLAPYSGETVTLSLTSIAFFDARNPSNQSVGTTLISGFDNVSILATDATAPSGVPEPATFLMTGIGLVGASLWRPRRRD